MYLVSSQKLRTSTLYTLRPSAQKLRNSTLQGNAGFQAPSVSTQQQSLFTRLRRLELDADERAKDLAKKREKEQMAAAGRNAMHELDMLAQKAGKAAAYSKMYRAWEPEVSEFDELPQLPQPGQVLKYFSCEDGIRALRSDDLQQNSGAQEYERLQERLRNMPPATHFAERGLYRVADDVEDLNAPIKAEWQSQPDENRLDEPQGADMHQQDHKEIENDSHGQQMVESGPDSTIVGGGHHDSTGSSRVKLPKIYGQPKAICTLNDEYLKKEYMTQRLVKTSASELIRARGRDNVEFELGCRILDFGEVKLGDAPLLRKIPLQNVSLERARFSVDCVEPPLKVTHQRGPVPAGLKTQLLVELTPTYVGNYQSEIVVRSPVNVLRCKVCACVTGNV